MLKKISKSGEYTHILIIMVMMLVYFITPPVKFNITFDSTLISPIWFWLNQMAISFPLTLKIITIMMIITIALYVNKIATSSEITPRLSFLSATLLTIFFLFSPDTSYLTGTLAVMLLLVFSFGNIMNLFGKQYPFKEILNASIAISIASMIIPYAIVFILFIWIGFLTYSINTWREWLISLIGLIVPYIYMFFAFFWNDNLDFIIGNYITFFNGLTIKFLQPNIYQWISVSLLLIIAFMSTMHFINDASDKIISIRKKMWLTFQFAFVTLMAIGSAGTAAPLLLPVLYIPISIMLSYSVHNQKRTRFYNIMMLLLICSFLINRLVP